MNRRLLLPIRQYRNRRPHRRRLRWNPPRRLIRHLPCPWRRRRRQPPNPAVGASRPHRWNPPRRRGDREDRRSRPAPSSPTPPPRGARSARRVWKRDPLAEVCANWQRPGPDDVPACIFCDDAYRGVVHNSGKGPDAFFYCCTCDKHFTRREADFFAGGRHGAC